MSAEVAVFPWMLDATGLKKEKNFFETRVVEYQNGDVLSWERAESMSVERTQNRLGLQSLPKPARDGIWIALVIGSSMLFSLVLACATPFAAIATVAGGMMCRRDAAILVGIAWLANQVVGYLVLGYPQTWDSFAWGGTIGVSALLATFAACEIARRWGASTISLALSFLVAFAIYEMILLAATIVLPSVDGAFGLEVMARVFGVNLLALAGLLLLYRAALVLCVHSHRPVNLSGVDV